MLGRDKWCEHTLAGTKVFLSATNPPPDPKCLKRLTKLAGGWLPEDYLEVMRSMDGFEGLVGENSEHGRWLRLLPCEDAALRTDRLSLPSLEPMLFLLGSDGAEIAYLLDRETHEWVELPYLDFGSLPEARLERRFCSFTSMLKA